MEIPNKQHVEYNVQVSIICLISPFFVAFSRLALVYCRGTGVYGALVAPLTLEEEEAWSDIKWSQTVHQFTYALNKSITNVTNAVIKENEMKEVEVTKTNFQPFKLKKKQKKSLIFRIATNTLDRDVTYAEWEYLSVFLNFQNRYLDNITGKKKGNQNIFEKKRLLQTCYT